VKPELGDWRSVELVDLLAQPQSALVLLVLGQVDAVCEDLLGGR